MKQHFATLGLPDGATKEEIQAAHRRLRKQHHPDHGGDTSRFQEVQEAYEFLTGQRQAGPQQPTEEQRVYQILVQAWMQSASPFDRPSKQLDTVKQEIKKGIRDTPKSTKKLEEELVKLESLHGYVESPDPLMNAYEDMLSGRIAQTRAQIQVQKDLEKALVMIDSMIAGYKLTAAGRAVDKEMAEKELPQMRVATLEDLITGRFGFR